MAFPMFLTIKQRHAERPTMVTLLGEGLCTIPIITTMVLLISQIVDRDPPALEASAWIALLGLSGATCLLGYGVLILNRVSYWIVLGLMVLGGTLYLGEIIQTRTFKPQPLISLLWIGYFLQPSVRAAFRY
jgi:hypothetical protein